jgi:hypothetical protein
MKIPEFLNQSVNTKCHQQKRNRYDHHYNVKEKTLTLVFNKYFVLTYGVKSLHVCYKLTWLNFFLIAYENICVVLVMVYAILSMIENINRVIIPDCKYFHRSVLNIETKEKHYFMFIVVVIFV